MALLFLTGVLYGLSYSLTGVGIAGGIPLTSFVLLMGMGGAVVALLLSLSQGRLPPLTLRHVSSYAVAGVSGYGVPYLTVGYVSGEGVPAGIISMLVVLAPILTYAGAVAFRLERIWWPRVLGFGVGIVGVALLVVPETSLPSRELVPWISAGALAADRLRDDQPRHCADAPASDRIAPLRVWLLLLRFSPDPRRGGGD